MAEIRVNATGGLKLYDADDSHYAQIVAGTITSNTDVMTLGHAAVVMGTKLDMNGSNLVLDADADTYLDTGTDDTIKFYVSGAHDLTIGANAINVLSGTTLTIDSGATITNSGTANGFSSADPASADGDTLGTASAEWSDLYLADSSVIYFGNDQDTTLTHTDGTGLTLNSTNKLCFNDASQYIQGASNAILDIAATDEIELTATLLDVNANLDVSGTSLLPTLGVVTAKDLGVGVHIRSADSGASVDGGADELVVEGSGDSGMTILSGTSSTGALNFGDSGDNNIGSLQYNHSDEAMRVYVGAEFVGSFQTGGLNFLDDNGVMFGDAPDWWFGAAAGESTMNIYKGGTQGEGTNEGVIQWAVGDSAESYLGVTGGEGGAATIYMYADQADDNNDKNRLMSKESNGFYIASYADGVFDNEFRVGDDLIHAEHTISVEAVDYAEYFEWKTELANDAKIEETYGLTVVLDGDKVRLAEAGEEAKVMGVVRPSKTSAIVGGDGIYWKDKYKKDVWGEYEKEAYTQVNWHILNAHGNSDKHHSYMKDRIPQYELIDSPEQDVKDWHLLDSNFKRDGDGNKIVLVTPITDEEKAAAKYTERTTHRKTGKTLMRKIFSDSFDQSQTYVNRSKRRKEWCIVGLLGQVPVRDTAIIPTHWTKMKNLESGIDLYFIK